MQKPLMQAWVAVTTERCRMLFVRAIFTYCALEWHHGLKQARTQQLETIWAYVFKDGPRIYQLLFTIVISHPHDSTVENIFAYHSITELI